MKGIRALKPRAAELHDRLGFDSLERAYKEGKNFSRWLEDEDPSDEYKDGLDAFERQLQIAGIHTTSDLERGFYADPFGAFDQDEHTRVLAVEWIVRQWRKVKANPRPAMRAVYASDDYALNSAFRPYVDAANERAEFLAPAIPVAELVALTSPIDGNAYRAIYLDEDPDNLHASRVTEASALPVVKMKHGERTIDLFKYGRRIEASYETLRRTPIDTLGIHLARIAVQAEVDKVAQVMEVMINGDGNAGTGAVEHNITDIDATATNDKATLEGWVGYKLKFKNPYALTTILAQEPVIRQIILLPLPNTNWPVAAFSAELGIGRLTPINNTLADAVRYGALDEAPAGKIVGFDRRFAIERVTEIGGSVSETFRWITNQIEILTLSEVEGYAKFDKNAVQILDVTE